MDVVLIGSGNIAYNLGISLKKVGFTIIQNFSRTLRRADSLSQLLNSEPINNISELNLNANLYIICVADDAISVVVESLPKKLSGIIVHTSGTKPINILAKFDRFGVFYPLQTFTYGTFTNLHKVPFLIEGSDGTSEKKLVAIANKLSSITSILDSKDRKKLHLAAVIACNFSNFMLTLSEEYCITNNLDFNYLVPLIKETFSKIEKSPPSKNQTGPAARKDNDTMNEHLGMLKNHPSSQKLYKLLSEGITKRLKQID